MRERRYRPYKKRCRQTDGTMFGHLLTFFLPFLPSVPLCTEPAIPGTPAGPLHFRSRRECQGGCTGQCVQSRAAEYRNCWWASSCGPSWLFPPVRYEIFKVQLCEDGWSVLAAWLLSENRKCRRLSSCGLIGVCILFGCIIAYWGHMSIDSGQHIHRNASAFRVLFRRECRDAYEISNCSDLEKSRSRNLKDCAQHGDWGRASTSRNHLFQEKAEWMVFRICNTDALLATIVPN